MGPSLFRSLPVPLGKSFQQTHEHYFSGGGYEIFNLPAVPLLFLAAGIGIILLALIVRERIADKLAGSLSGLSREPGGDNELTKSLKPPIRFLILILAAWSALKLLQMVEKPLAVNTAVDTGGELAVTFVSGWALFKVAGLIETGLRKKAQRPDHWMDPHLVPVIGIGLKSAIAVGILITAAQILGYSVSAIVASLGIGGVAVALAAKDTLANFFGSIAVMVDKPFRIGDWIKAPGLDGVVEQIGLRSTRIRTDDKTVLAVPNDKLAAMVIENMDRRKDRGINMRRVNLTLGLAYQTGAKDIERAVEAVRGVLRASDKIAPDALWVHFSEFGDSTLNITVNYFIRATAQEEYLKVRQDMNIAMVRALEDLGIRLAPKYQPINPAKPD